MGKSGAFFTGHAQGRCRKCRTVVVGPGDRCPPCATEARAKADKQRRKRKRR
jgi:rRNA maturation endonuclease Nob1